MENKLKISDFIQFYEISLKNIDREDNLIHYRLTWTLQSNAALLFIFMINGDTLKYFGKGIYPVICALGITLTVLSLLAIRAARHQLRYICSGIEEAAMLVPEQERLNTCNPEQFREHADNYKNLIHAHTGLPRPFGERGRFDLAKPGIYAPYLYCWAIIGLWTAFGVHLLSK